MQRMTQPAFTRAEPDSRKASLIEATIRVLAVRGAGGISVRHVAVAAGVSPGLVNHYFDGIEALVAASYTHLAAQVATALDAALADSGTEPRARLHAYVAANFDPSIADADALATWIAFWSLVRARAAIAALHEDIYAAYRRTIEALLLACGVEGAALRRRHAIAITALIDGLWLELCLSGTAFSADEARAIARDYVDTLLASAVLETAVDGHQGLGGVNIDKNAVVAPSHFDD